MKKISQAIEHRWQAFVDEYIKHFNAQQAVEDCGCYKARGRAAQAHGARLIANDNVQKMIREAIEARNARTHVDQDRVILELARVGFFRLESAAWWADDGLHLVRSDDLSTDDAAAIESVEVEVTEYVSESGVTTRTKRKIKAHSKLAALDKLARHVGLYEADNKRTIEFGNGLSGLLQHATRNGNGKVLDQTTT